jgi:hypothetical protein
MPPILPLTDEDIKRFASKHIYRPVRRAYLRRGYTTKQDEFVHVSIFCLPEIKTMEVYERYESRRRGQIYGYTLNPPECLYAIQYKSTLTYRSQNATHIVEAIWTKWDFGRNDILPAKTIRLGSVQSRLQHTDTGDLY